MIFLKTPDQVNGIYEANQIGAEFLQDCFDFIKPGIYTEELGERALRFCERKSVRPSFYGYSGFPSPVCVSINEELIHGIPGEREILNGDLVSVDFGVEKDGYFSDSAFTKCVGEVSKVAKRITDVTKEALYIGIDAISEGRLNSISEGIYKHITKNSFDVVREYVGHGVGLDVHESPNVSNYVPKFNVNWKLRSGMVIAIEPIVVENDFEVETTSNKWTVVTKDGGLSAHFEHSVAILENEVKVLSAWR